MLEWFGSLSDSVLALGYIGVFIALVIEGLGLPFPGDAVMAFYGFSAARGDISLGGAILFSILGYLTGAITAYLLSRRFGAEWMEKFSHRFMISHRSMMRTSGLLDKYGPWLLVPGRFLPGVRSVSSYVAGFGKMDFRPFLLYTVVGVTIWCATWVGIGYWAGENIRVVMDAIQSGLAYLTGAICVALLALWMFRRWAR